jgi:hypothetical protein
VVIMSIKGSTRTGSSHVKPAGAVPRPQVLSYERSVLKPSPRSSSDSRTRSPSHRHKVTRCHQQVGARAFVTVPLSSGPTRVGVLGPQRMRPLREVVPPLLPARHGSSALAAERGERARAGEGKGGVAIPEAVAGAW